MKTLKIMYWITTGVLALQLGSSAVFNLMHHPDAMAVIQKLGYPPYVANFLGVAKLLGLAVLLTPALQRFKDWAYAGLAINTVLAFYSYVALGMFVPELAASLIAFTLVFASYLLGKALEKNKLRQYA